MAKLIVAKTLHTLPTPIFRLHKLQSGLICVPRVFVVVSVVHEYLVAPEENIFSVNCIFVRHLTIDAVADK